MLLASLHCTACKTDTTIQIIEESEQTYFCPHCGSMLMQCVPVQGWIYCLSNPSFPHLVKIGFTTRTVEDRLVELNGSTSLPTPFEIEFFLSSENPMSDEATAHDCLDEHRQSDRREFFKLSPSTAYVLLSKALPVAKIIRKRFNPEPETAERRFANLGPVKTPQEQTRKFTEDVNAANARRIKMGW